jgi:G3E family GTPase
MIPICLITGFLGTGKTTLIKRIVAGNRERRLVYLINEFSALDIDGSIVSAENPDVVSIPGGSIFCKCLVSEFIGQLRRIVSEWGEAEGVVIEASGMANPKVIEEMLAETGLDEFYRLATIVSVVDPNSFLKLRHTLPNILAQIETADVVLLNKSDCNPRERVAEARTAIAELNPAADVKETVMCAVDLDLFAEHAPRGLQGEYAKCRDPNYATFVTEHPCDPDRLAALIRSHADVIYRVKGRFAGEYIDYSIAGLVRSPLPGGDSGETRLAWIVKGGTEEDIIAELQGEALHSSIKHESR